MDRKTLKKLMSILTAMAMTAISFAGAFSVAAEEINVISENDVTEAILYDHADDSETPDNVVSGDYDVASAMNEEGKIEVAITANGVKLHENANNNPGYWVGFAVIAPEGATKASGTFGDDSYADENVVAVNEEGNMGVAFYVNAGTLEPKTEATLQWFNEEGAISEEEIFIVDLSNVTLNIENYVPNVTTARIVDNANVGRNNVYDTYSVIFDAATVEIDMTKLCLHKNGEGKDGYWTGFAVEKVENADFVKYTFGDQSGVEAVTDIDGETGDKEGVAFYIDASAPKTYVKIQWFKGDAEGENIALTNPVELTMNLDNVEYYHISEENVQTAIFNDNSETPKEELYTDYSVEAKQSDGVITVDINASNVEKHNNGEGTAGYWTGFAVEAPECAEKMRYAFGTTSDITLGDTEAVHTIADGKMGIAFYINAGNSNPKTYAKLQWLDANGATITAETDFVIDLSDVTLAFDYVPAVNKANVQDSTNSEKSVYESYDIEQSTNDNGEILVDIAMTELAEHKNGSGTAGYWTGFAVEAPADANKMKVVFGTDENVNWNNAEIYDVEANVVGEKNGAAFYTNVGDEAPKTIAMLQWFKDEEALSNVVTFKINLDNVKLNWIKKDSVAIAPTTGKVKDAEVVTEQIDGIIKVKYTAENLDKHPNGVDVPGYWIGFSVAAPEGAEKVNATFGEDVYSDEPVYAINEAGDLGVAFYTDVGNANPKTEATLQWLKDGEPLSAPTKFIVDLSGISLEELPYILSDDVKEAKVVDQSNTSQLPYSSYSVSAKAGENGVIVVDINMKNLKSHKNGEDKTGCWTGFSVVNPENAAYLRYAFSADKTALSSMKTVPVESDTAFYANMSEQSPKKYVRLQWFDETGTAITNATDFEMNFSGVKLYSNRSGSSGRGSSSYYTVAFETNGGSEITSVRAKKEQAISAPSAPEKEGYIFEGWYTDKELTTKYDFSSVVTKSFKLYAKWIEKIADFTDVNKDAWYYNVVEEAVKKGLMKGISETEFAPELPMTRAMFVTILYRAASKPEVKSEILFKDVDINAYYADAVKWASADGIVNGMTETEFAPDADITREQMAVMLYRYANILSKPEVEEKKLMYTDEKTISEYAYEAIVWAEDKQIMKGNDDGSFAPFRNATRAEAAAVFVRFINTLK